jgi:hypothetical protein
LCVSLVLASAACRPETRPTVLRGLVVDMRAASFVQVAALTLRTERGDVVDMTVEGDAGITASHLREHMVLAEPVAVTVRYDGSRVIATRIDDAPPETSPAR